MSTVITGTLAPVRQPDRIEYSPLNGRQTWAVYQSADSALITTAREGYETSGQTCRSYGDGAIFTVEVLQEAADSDTYALQDSWEIVANELQRGDFQSNMFYALSVANQDAVIAEVKANTPPEDSAFAANTQQYFLVKRAYFGSDSFSTSQYVLRHTTIASPSYNSNVSDENVESLYSFAGLIDEITDGGLWVNPCPGRLVAKIESIPTPADVNADDANFYYWSWRKLPSTETQQPDGNIQIQTEYWLGMWPTPHYRIV